MDLSMLFGQVASLLLKLLIFPTTLWKWGRHRLHIIRLGARFPGPFALPLVGNVLDSLSFDSADYFDWAIRTFKKHAPILRYYLGPILVITSDNARDNELILSGYKYINKSHLYNKFLEPWLGTGLLISSGAKWHSRRKMLTPAFHFKILDQFQPVFLSCGDEFVRQLRKRAGGAPFDVCPLVKLFTLDVICETAMGVKLNAQTDSGSEYVNAVEEIQTTTLQRIRRPWLYPDFIFYRTFWGHKYKKCLDVLHGTTHRVIRERRDEMLKISESLGDSAFDIDELGRRRRVAFLDLLLLEARDGKLSDADIREEVDTFMFEGHDTTASVISFTMYLLSLHPDVQDRVLEELRNAFNWSQPPQPTLQQLSELKYLEMVIKESLRMYPPVMVSYRDITEDEILPRTGQVIPAGTVMETNIFCIHRNEEVFSEPEKFNPERFSVNESATRHPFAYIPFMAGPRNCIGQRFAMLELKSVLSKLLWHFHILPDPSFTPRLAYKLILKSENGVWVRLEERR